MKKLVPLMFALLASVAAAQTHPNVAGSALQTLGGWRMQDASKITDQPPAVSAAGYGTAGWYRATVPGTVLATLVDNGVYPDPLFGENMRAIPESLNKTGWWYRTSFRMPAAVGRHTWLHFAGINYLAQVWLNGQQVGTIKGAFVRGDFDISTLAKPGTTATLAVLVAPQPHPGTPHEHTVANGVGKNGGDTAIDGPTFLSTIGWDWLPAVRDRDSGIWLPVTVDTTGPVRVRDPFVTAELNGTYDAADLHVAAAVENLSQKEVRGTLRGTIAVQPNGDRASAGTAAPVSFSKPLTLAAGETQDVSLSAADMAALHMQQPRLWWPNGYGPQNLYTLTLRFVPAAGTTSGETTTSFGIRRIAYQVADSDNLTLSVNGVKVMVRGGNWGLDDAMKRIPRERLDAQFHMHALANLNIVRNWVGQSTSPDFYAAADKYGILLWDEFFQPNPSDGPDVPPAGYDTYLANVQDKIARYRNHPSIAVWCARNEGYPPKELDALVSASVRKLDPSRLYQSNSADGRGVSSHGPYYWRAPREFYKLTESFKTETGSVSIPTIESIQGMLPQQDWETQNDDWAQHDLAKGAQRGDQYPAEIAKRYGSIRNLADFVRKGQLANYEAFRAMYEGRNAQMFTATTGVITWMSHPAQPSFVWQLYHHDLEPNASLYAAKKASETVHVQLNESTGMLQVVNNKPDALSGLTLRSTVYGVDSKVLSTKVASNVSVAGSATFTIDPATFATGSAPGNAVPASSAASAVTFVKLDLTDSTGALLSTNFYWRNEGAVDDLTGVSTLPTAALQVGATQSRRGDTTVLHATVTNPTDTVALLAHLQLRNKATGKRVLPVFYSDNYLSLVPGESRTLTIEAATKDIAGTPALYVDGFNVDVVPASGPVTVQRNDNAQPMHWPASDLVPAVK